LRSRPAFWPRRNGGQATHFYVPGWPAGGPDAAGLGAIRRPVRPYLSPLFGGTNTMSMEAAWKNGTEEGVFRARTWGRCGRAPACAKPSVAAGEMGGSAAKGGQKTGGREMVCRRFGVPAEGAAADTAPPTNGCPRRQVCPARAYFGTGQEGPRRASFDQLGRRGGAPKLPRPTPKKTREAPDLNVWGADGLGRLARVVAPAPTGDGAVLAAAFAFGRRPCCLPRVFALADRPVPLWSSPLLSPTPFCLGRPPGAASGGPTRRRPPEAGAGGARDGRADGPVLLAGVGRARAAPGEKNVDLPASCDL
jgi:hypothetical protein